MEDNAYSAQSSQGKKGDVADDVAAKNNLNNRRIYHWKDGQRATPTGHEATGVGGGYSALMKRKKPLAKDTVPAKTQKPVEEQDQR